MKSKSFVKCTDYLDAAHGLIQFGEVIFESYWQRKKDGSIIESYPLLSEQIDQMFYPYRALIGKDHFIYIEDWNTAFKVESAVVNNINIERIIYSPNIKSIAHPNPCAALKKNYDKYYCANNNSF